MRLTRYSTLSCALIQIPAAHWHYAAAAEIYPHACSKNYPNAYSTYTHTVSHFSLVAQLLTRGFFQISITSIAEIRLYIYTCVRSPLESYYYDRLYLDTDKRPRIVCFLRAIPIEIASHSLRACVTEPALS